MTFRIVISRHVVPSLQGKSGWRKGLGRSANKWKAQLKSGPIESDQTTSDLFIQRIGARHDDLSVRMIW
jgi:hypothetical protein